MTFSLDAIEDVVFGETPVCVKLMREAMSIVAILEETHWLAEEVQKFLASARQQKGVHNVLPR